MNCIIKEHLCRNSLLAILLIFGVLPAQAADQEQITSGDGEYRLAGTVKGLADKLIIELNDDEIVKITEDGVFKFQSKFAVEQEYSVKIKKPAPNHLCEVKNGQGIIAADGKPQVDIVCRQTGRWDHPAGTVDNISPDGQNGVAPVAALDGSGNAIIVWSQFDGKFWRIFKSEYRENKWQNPGSLKDAISPGNSDAKNPKVAMSDNGDIVIAWEQVLVKNIRIYKAEFRKGQWTLPKSTGEFISIGDKDAFGVDVAMDDLGNTILVWSQESAKNVYPIYKSEYRNGVWHHPDSLKDAISVPSDSIAMNPRVVMNNRGEALVVWQQSINRREELFKSEYRNNAWIHPKSIDDHISPKDKVGGAYYPLLALADNGRALITWQQIHNRQRLIYKSEFDGSAWIKPLLTEVISPMTNDYNFAINNSLAMDNKGNAIILWSLKDKLRQVLYLSNFTGGKWQHPTEKDRFSDSAINYNLIPFAKVAMADSGKAVIVWEQEGEDNIRRVFMTEFDNGVWHLPGKQISTLDNQAGNVSIASAKNGSFLVVWEQTDGKNAQIYKSEFHVLKE